MAKKSLNDVFVSCKKSFHIMKAALGLAVLLALLIGIPAHSFAGCTDEFLVENNTTAPLTVGQSWTPTCDGTLQSITVKADTPNAGLMTLKIYNGQSLAGPDLLSTQTGLPALVHGENTYAVGGVAITAGQQYTFLFTNELGGVNGIKFRYDVTNSYAGGMATAGAGFVAGSDIWFRASVCTATLTYTAGTGGTIIGASPQTVDCGADGSAVRAVPRYGYHFSRWSDGVATAIRTDMNVAADLAVTAFFARDIYTLEYTAGDHGAISGSTPQQVLHGGSGSEVFAVPDPGFAFTQWDDGSIDNPRLDSNVTGNISVTAFFETVITTFALNYTAGDNGSIIGDSTQTVGQGTDGSPVTAQPDPGYRFVKWSDGVATATRQDTHVMADIAVTAEFTAVWTSDEDLPEDLDLDGNGTPDRDQDNIAVVSDGSGLYFGFILPEETALEYLEWIDDASVPDMTNRPDAFPLGLVTFRVLTASPGDTIALTLYCSQPIPEGAIWYKHDPVNGWYDYSGQAVFSEDRLSVTLTFQDGGIGDADGVANGVVVDPSGPALFYEDNGDGTDGGDGDGHHNSGGGCFLRSVLQ